MDRSVGIESARNRLGQLTEEVAASGEAVRLTKRGIDVAVLVGADEYEALREFRRSNARANLQQQLEEIRDRVASAGLDVSVVDEAILSAEDI